MWLVAVVGRCLAGCEHMCSYTFLITESRTILNEVVDNESVSVPMLQF